MDSKERKIQDYLHLYLGAECIIGDRNWKSQNIHPDDLAPYTDPEFGKPIRSKIDLHVIQAFAHKVALILRQLSDMTEEEAIELAKLSEYEPHFNDVKIERGKFDNDIIVTWQGSNESRERFNATGELFYCSDRFLWLLKNHFDLFHLIEDGLAIDSTTLKTQQ